MTAARSLGFVFRSRTPETITVIEMGQKVVYDLLAVLDFNNVRKRMSVIGEETRFDPRPLGPPYCRGHDLC